MSTQNNYKHWEYRIIRYVPTTPKGGGEINWEERCECRDIYLPAYVEDPAEYLEESSKNEFREYMEYRNFKEAHQS